MEGEGHGGDAGGSSGPRSPASGAGPERSRGVAAVAVAVPQHEVGSSSRRSRSPATGVASAERERFRHVLQLARRPALVPPPLMAGTSIQFQAIISVIGTVSLQRAQFVMRILKWEKTQINSTAAIDTIPIAFQHCFP